VPLSADDRVLSDRLAALGFIPRVIAAPAFMSSDATSSKLVVLSASIGTDDVGIRVRDLASPVLTMKPESLPSLRMTLSVPGVDFGMASGQTDVAVTLPGHPLAAGFTATTPASSAGTTFTWGNPAQAAVRVATIVGHPSQAAVFGYEAGASMAGQTAPARRVSWLAGPTAAATLTDSGLALFDAAVRWAGGVASPTVSWCQGGSFQVQAVFDPGGAASSDGRVDFANVARVQIPASLLVVSGASGEGSASLTLGSSSGSETCVYRGHAALGSSDPRQRAMATQFVFDSCSAGSLPGFTATVASISLHLDSADTTAGATTVVVNQSCAGDVPIVDQAIAANEGVYSPNGVPAPVDSPEVHTVPPVPGEYPDPTVGATNPEVAGSFTPAADPALVPTVLP
jgi:hypothetical protein